MCECRSFLTSSRSFVMPEMGGVHKHVPCGPLHAKRPVAGYMWFSRGWIRRPTWSLLIFVPGCGEEIQTVRAPQGAPAEEGWLRCFLLSWMPQRRWQTSGGNSEKLAYLSYSNCLCFYGEKRLCKKIFSVAWACFPQNWTTTQLPRASEHFDSLMSFWVPPCVRRQATQQKIGKRWPLTS